MFCIVLGIRCFLGCFLFLVLLVLCIGFLLVCFGRSSSRIGFLRMGVRILGLFLGCVGCVL